jgi:hypothetical protein
MPVEKISWKELGGRKTNHRLSSGMLHRSELRSIKTRPVPHCLTKPLGIYAVEFDRMFAIEKVRETLIAPLVGCSLPEILELVATAYILENPDAQVIGDELTNLINHADLLASL